MLYLRRSIGHCVGLAVYGLTVPATAVFLCYVIGLYPWRRYGGLPPPLHLTTSKAMVIVWRLRGNIIRTVLYVASVLPLQWAQLTKTVHTVQLGCEFDFLCIFRLLDLSLYFCMVFILDS